MASHSFAEGNWCPAKPSIYDDRLVGCRAVGWGGRTFWSPEVDDSPSGGRQTVERSFASARLDFQLRFREVNSLGWER
jgi:hypothetical protein